MSDVLCRKCKQYKPETDYYRNASSSIGRATKCKPCMRLDNTTRDQANKLKREEAKRLKNERFVYYGSE